MNHTLLRIEGNRRETDVKVGAGLLMTATLIAPPSAVARSNAKDRLNDYLTAFRCYLEMPATAIDRILFVDNSAGDIAPIAELARRQPHDKIVEILSFQGNDHPPERGKAYGEFRLMDYGLAHSGLFGTDDIVWKTTGRLKFLNLPQIIQRCVGMEFDILCDLHNVPLIGSGRWSGYENMDLRVFAFRRHAYDAVLRGLWIDHPDGLDANFLYHHMLEKHGNLRIFRRFPMQVRLQGISGRHQRDYSSFSQRTKDVIRAGLRRFLPSLWI